MEIFPVHGELGATALETIAATSGTRQSITIHKEPENIKQAAPGREKRWQHWWMTHSITCRVLCLSPLAWKRKPEAAPTNENSPRDWVTLTGFEAPCGSPQKPYYYYSVKFEVQTPTRQSFQNLPLMTPTTQVFRNFRECVLHYSENSVTFHFSFRPKFINQLNIRSN